MHRTAAEINFQTVICYGEPSRMAAEQGKTKAFTLTHRADDLLGVTRVNDTSCIFHLLIARPQKAVCTTGTARHEKKKKKRTLSNASLFFEEMLSQRKKGPHATRGSVGQSHKLPIWEHCIMTHFFLCSCLALSVVASPSIATLSTVCSVLQSHVLLHPAQLFR
jgi:hypothetical protein